MFRGPATISFFADDVPAAAAWYADLFGVEPYFARPVDGPPAYVEFRIGDRQTELGIVDTRYAPHPAGMCGAIVFWQVDELEATVADLQRRGATVHEARTERGEGFVTASVVDPFGNILGVMHNPHYLSVLGADERPNEMPA